MIEEVEKKVSGEEEFICHLLEGRGSEEEVRRFSEWVKEGEHKALFEQYKRLWNATSGVKVPPDAVEQAAREYVRYMKARGGRRKVELRRYWGYVAGVVILFSVGYFLSRTGESRENMDLLAGLSVASERVVVLQKADGQVVHLVDSLNRIQEAGGTVIERSGEREIAYSSVAESDETLFNTLSVPAGNRMKIVLADGTVVWLNGESVIRYPINFSGKERKVSLNGEAYFDVKRDEHHPFVVVTGKMDVKVLGTSFNLNAYAADERSRMTLVEGSVQVMARGEKLVAVPGEEVAFDGVKLSRRFVDTESVTTWKEGVLVLNRLTFDELLQRVHRWYGVTFVNQADISSEELFNGKFDQESVETVMKTIGMSLGIRYTIKNDTILLHN